MGTAFVLILVLAGIGLAIRSIVKDKKAGKSCGCGCEHCQKHCQ